MARSIDTLSPEERARHYRESAIEAYRMAEAAKSPGLKNVYMNAATGWHTMALEIELTLRADQILDALDENPIASRR